MHDDLKRKIAASLDLPEDASPDPDVVEALENDPQAHSFARGLYVIEGAMQNWPDSSRSASEWEKMAATIERRLGEAPWEKAAKVRGAVVPLSWDPLGAPPLRESEDVAASVSNVAKVAERKPMSRPDDRDDDDLEGLAALTKTSSGPSSTSLAPTPRSSLTPGPSISDDAMDESSGIVDIQKLAALALKGPPPPKTDELKPTDEESGADHDTAMLASQVVPAATEGARERKASVKAATPAAAKSGASVPAATAAQPEERRKGGGVLWAVLLVAAGGAGVFVVMNQNRSSTPAAQSASSEPAASAGSEPASPSAGSAPAPAAAAPAAAAAPTTAAAAQPAADPAAQANAAAAPSGAPGTGAVAPAAPDTAAAAPGAAPPSPPAAAGAGGSATQLAMNTPPPSPATAGVDQPSARAARTTSSDHGSTGTTHAAAARPSAGASSAAGATAAVTPPPATGTRTTTGSGSTSASTASAATTASGSTTTTAAPTGGGARAGSGATASAGSTGGSGGGGNSIDDLMARAVGRTPGSSSGSTATASSGSGGGGGSGASSGASAAGGGGSAANSGELPDRPSRSQVTSTMAPLASAIRACSQGQTGMATVAMTVASDGSVTNASISGPFNSAAISCMTGVVRRAHFPAFRRPSVPILYPFSIQPRNGGAAE